MTLDQAGALACATARDVVVSHRSAGRIWKLRRLGIGPEPDHIEVLHPGRAHRLLPGVVTHRCHRIEPTDVVERPDGIRVTSPARTVFDLAAVLSDERLESIIEQVVHDGLTTIAALHRTGERLREHGRNGSARFARVLGSRPIDTTTIDSDLELVVERAIMAAGLPRPHRQHPLRLVTGELIHVDFYWDPEAEVLEIDHVTWHGGKRDLTEDKRRDRLIRRLGIHTTRVTDVDVRERLDNIIEDLRAILGRSGVRSAS
jgi:hypothetical protein